VVAEPPPVPVLLPPPVPVLDPVPVPGCVEPLPPLEGHVVPLLVQPLGAAWHLLVVMSQYHPP
jgi:hypothetical protein